MLYNINLNQRTLVELTPEITLDEAVILNYLNFICKSINKKIEKERVDGYTWIDYSRILNDLPLLHNRCRQSLIKKISNLEKFGYIKTKKIRIKNKTGIRKFVLLQPKIEQLFCDSVKDIGNLNYQGRQFKLPKSVIKITNTIYGIDNNTIISNTRDNPPIVPPTRGDGEGEVSSFSPDQRKDVLPDQGEKESLISCSDQSKKIPPDPKGDVSSKLQKINPKFPFVNRATDSSSSDNEKHLCIFAIFKTVNPNIVRLYGHTSQRQAINDLESLYGFERVKDLAMAAVSCINQPYAPMIDTPVKLRDKISSLISFLQRQKTINKPNIVFGTDFINKK